MTKAKSSFPVQLSCLHWVGKEKDEFAFPSLESCQFDILHPECVGWSRPRLKYEWSWHTTQIRWKKNWPNYFQNLRSKTCGDIKMRPSKVRNTHHLDVFTKKSYLRERITPDPRPLPHYLHWVFASAITKVRTWVSSMPVLLRSMLFVHQHETALTLPALKCPA